jgi:hypothetical protein
MNDRTWHEDDEHVLRLARRAERDRPGPPPIAGYESLVELARGGQGVVYRAIRSEGQVVISGFNHFSLFGAKRYFGRSLTPPWNGSFIALYRLKDWLSLLGFEVTGGALDCYVPPFANETWRARFGFFEAAGDRWWPIAGGVYYLRATKRVLGMRIITPAWERRQNGLATAPRQARQCIERVE